MMNQLNIFNQLKGKSQADKVLWHLENHGRISNAQAHELYGIRHCPSVIRNVKEILIKNGGKYEIINERKNGCNRFGEPVWWDDYVLVEKKARNVPA